MNGKSITTKAALLTALVLFTLPARPAAAQAPQSQAQQKPTYTIPEYNAFQACSAMSQRKDYQGTVRCLDDFVEKFPNSTLLPYVYQLYFPAYAQLKNYPKTMEYADKVIALGDKVDASVRLQAIQTRCQVFPTAFNPKAPDAHDQLVKERDAATEGAKLLEAYPKPPNSTMTDQQFADQKKPGLAFFQSSAGFADLQLKDYPAAIDAFKQALTNNPNDAVSYYRLGVAYLSSAPTTPPASPSAPATANPPAANGTTAAGTAATPPAAATPAAAPSAGSEQKLDGFWNLARAINLKIPGDTQVKTYLRQQILAYEQPGCDSLVDAQLSELLQLAGTSGDRPATYSIPSQADLDKIRQSSNILSVISDLSAGGDKAKLTWLAICSAQFPEVVGKIIDVKPGDGFSDFMVYTGATQDDMEKATTANMDVKVWTTGTPPPPAAAAGTPQAAPITPQPDVVRLQKDDGIRFSGTLVSYDPNPFLLRWDQVKVDTTVIPEKQEQGKHHRVPPKRNPGKR